jgi:hypothetical protein
MIDIPLFYRAGPSPDLPENDYSATMALQAACAGFALPE